MKPLNCPVCRAPFVPPAPAPGVQAVACPACREPLDLEIFPAIERAPQAGRAGQMALPGEAVCYVHADRRAERACDRCGRFMCALCDIQLGAQRVCVACFEEGRRGGKIAQLQRQRTVFAPVAARMALLSFFLGPLAPVLGVPAIGLAIWGLMRPTSVTGSRYIGSASIAILVGLALSIGWGLFWIGIASEM